MVGGWRSGLGKPGQFFATPHDIRNAGQCRGGEPATSSYITLAHEKKRPGKPGPTACNKERLVNYKVSKGLTEEAYRPSPN
eukprot:1154418-Pelagomonas_calceolata.AAC.4